MTSSRSTEVTSHLRRPATVRSGCRPTGVPGGIASPRSTSDAGPTVDVAPIDAAGRMTLCGPRVAPGSSVTVSMLMIRSWNRWVCSTQPRLTVAASPNRTRSASGSQ